MAEIIVRDEKSVDSHVYVKDGDQYKRDRDSKDSNDVVISNDNADITANDVVISNDNAEITATALENNMDNTLEIKDGHRENKQSITGGHSDDDLKTSARSYAITETKLAERDTDDINFVDAKNGFSNPAFEDTPTDNLVPEKSTHANRADKTFVITSQLEDSSSRVQAEIHFNEVNDDQDRGQGGMIDKSHALTRYGQNNLSSVGNSAGIKEEIRKRQRKFSVTRVYNKHPKDIYYHEQEAIETVTTTAASSTIELDCNYHQSSDLTESRDISYEALMPMVEVHRENDAPAIQQTRSRCSSERNKKMSSPNSMPTQSNVCVRERRNSISKKDDHSLRSKSTIDLISKAEEQDGLNPPEQSTGETKTVCWRSENSIEPTSHNTSQRKYVSNSLTCRPRHSNISRCSSRLSRRSVCSRRRTRVHRHSSRRACGSRCAKMLVLRKVPAAVLSVIVHRDPMSQEDHDRKQSDTNTIEFNDTEEHFEDMQTFDNSEEIQIEDDNYINVDVPHDHHEKTVWRHLRILKRRSKRANKKCKRKDSLQVTRKTLRHYLSVSEAEVAVDVADGRTSTASSTEPPVNSYMRLAFLVIFCNLPLGVAAMVFSLKSEKSYQCKEYAESRRYARIGRKLSLIGVVLTAVILTIVLIVRWPQAKNEVLPDGQYSIDNTVVLK